MSSQNKRFGSAKHGLDLSLRSKLRFRPATPNAADHFTQRLSGPGPGPFPVGNEGATGAGVIGTASQVLAKDICTQTGTAPLQTILGASSVALKDLGFDELNQTGISNATLPTIIGDSNVTLAVDGLNQVGRVFEQPPLRVAYQLIDTVAVITDATGTVSGGPVFGVSDVALLDVSAAQAASSTVAGASSVTLSNSGNTATGIVVDIGVLGTSATVMADVGQSAAGSLPLRAGANNALAGVLTEALATVAMAGSSAMTLASVLTVNNGRVWVSGGAAVSLDSVTSQVFGAVKCSGAATTGLKGVGTWQIGIDTVNYYPYADTLSVETITKTASVFTKKQQVSILESLR